MGIETLPVKKDPTWDNYCTGAVFKCNTSGLVFGPVWDSVEEADEFLEWYNDNYTTDLREIAPMEIAEKRIEWLRLLQEAVEPAEIEWEGLETIPRPTFRIRPFDSGRCDLLQHDSKLGYQVVGRGLSQDEAKLLAAKCTAWQREGRVWL